MSGMPDFVTGTTFHARVMTVNGSGKPTTVGNSPAVVFYQDGNTTAFSAGLTLSTDFASVTGLSSIQVLATTSATGVAAGSTYSLHFSAGTVSGVSVIGYPIFSWTLEKQSALRPTTAGRTLAVAATGGAAIDWGNVGNPGTTVDLAATTLFLVDTATDVTNDVGAIVTAVNTVVPARVTAQGIDVGAIVTAFNTIAPANVTAISTVVPANVTAASASGIAQFFLVNSGTTYAAATAGSVVKETADNAGGSALTVTAISSGVWDRDATSNQVQGSFGQAIGDPGADATTLYQAAVTDAAGTDIAADIIAMKADVTSIKAKVTALTFTVAAQVDANIQSVNDTTVTGDGGAGTEWGP